MFQTRTEAALLPCSFPRSQKRQDGRGGILPFLQAQRVNPDQPGIREQQQAAAAEIQHRAVCQGMLRQQ